MTATPITDSPWLWFALYSGVGLAALVATGGRFGKRQANIEDKYQARTAVASGELQVNEEGSGAKHSAGVPEYSTPDHTVIVLWPLEIILGVIFAASLVLLLRDRKRLWRESAAVVGSELSADHADVLR